MSSGKHYIYLIRLREFVRSSESIYKIGKTTMEPNRRLAGYPKGSEVLLFIQVSNCHSLEKDLLLQFQSKFIHRTDLGSEYFSGNPDEMMKLIIHSIFLPDLPERAQKEISWESDDPFEV